MVMENNKKDILKQFVNAAVVDWLICMDLGKQLSKSDRGLNELNSALGTANLINTIRISCRFAVNSKILIEMYPKIKGEI